MNYVSSAHAETVIEHRFADTVNQLSPRNQSIGQDVQRCLVGHQQTAPKEICFRFDPTVMRALASFV